MLDARDMSQQEVADVVVRLMAQHIKKDGGDWTMETELAEIGIDSFDFVEFVFLVEDEFGIEIEYNANDVSKSLTTIGAVAAAIKSVAAGKGAVQEQPSPDHRAGALKTQPA